VTSSISPQYHLPELRDRRGKEVEGLRFRTTWDIIEAVERGLLPDKMMINTHPQRWDDRFGPWVRELVWQNVKNIIKGWMIRFAKDD